MKKIFALAVLFAAVSMVSCGCFQKKAENAEAAATECCGDCAEGECEKAEGECCGECAAEEAPAAEECACGEGAAEEAPAEVVAE